MNGRKIERRVLEDKEWFVIDRDSLSALVELAAETVERGSVGGMWFDTDEKQEYQDLITEASGVLE